MLDKNGVEIVEDDNSNQLSQEDLISKAVADGISEGMKRHDENVNNANNPPANDPDPFDFSDIDAGINNQNENINTNEQNINNQNNNDQNNQNNQPLHDPRVDDILANVNANTKDVETNRRMTSMNNFIMEFNNEVKGVPELEVHRNEAIEEAKKSIGSGGYIPASDMLAYLDGKASIAKRRNAEENKNPNIGGDNQLNPNGEEKKFDPWAEDVTADDIKEHYKDVIF